MNWKSSMASELTSLLKKIDDDKRQLVENVDELEEMEKSRRNNREFLLLEAFRKIQENLNDVETELVKDIKSDAYDTTRQLNKVILFCLQSIFVQNLTVI